MTAKKYLWCVLCSITLLAQSSTSVAQWRRIINNPDDYVLLAVAISPGGKAVAVGEGGTVRLSDGDLQKWTSFTSHTQFPLRDAIRLDDGDVYAVGDSGVILKVQSSGTSSLLNSGVSSSLTAMACNKVGDYFIVGNDGVLMSTHDFQQWKKPTIGTSANLLDIEFAGQFGWVLSDSGEIFQSSNDGESWLPLSQDTIKRYNHLLHLNDYSVLVSNSNWKIAVLNPSGLTPVMADTIVSGWGKSGFSVLAAMDSLIIYANRRTPSTEALYRSTNGGMSWEYLGESSFQSAVITPTAQLLGVDWQSVVLDGNTITGTATHVQASSFVHDTALLVAHTADQLGQFFTRPGIRALAKSNMKTLFDTTALWTFSDITEVGFSGIAACGRTLGDSGFVSLSTDGGAHWRSTVLGQGVRPYRVRFLDRYTGYVIGYDGAWKSTDGGSTWQSFLNMQLDSVRDVDFVTDSLLVATTRYCVAVSSDRGASWRMSVPGVRPNRVFALDSQFMWICARTTELANSHPFLYRSTDGGLTWSLLLNGIDSGISDIQLVHFSDSLHGAIAAASITGRVILLTSDAGMTWKNPAGLPGEFLFTSIRVTSQGDVLALNTREDLFVYSSIEPSKKIDISPVHSNEIQVFPNPAHSRLTVFDPSISQNLSYSVLDVLGRTVQLPAFTSPVRFEGLDQLPNGEYFLVVQSRSSNERRVKAFIVQH